MREFTDDKRHMKWLAQLIECPGLKGHTRSSFIDIIQRIEDGRQRCLSWKQRSWIETMVTKFLDREGKTDFQLQDDYGNVAVHNTQQGPYIFVHGVPVGKVVVTKEGCEIIAWLTTALDEIVEAVLKHREEARTNRYEYDARNEEKLQETTQDDVPF